MYAALLLVFVQIVYGAHDHGEYNVCLSCPRVSHPRECQTSVQIWPEERCYTEMLLLMNGSRIYGFGYSTASACSQYDLQESSLGRGRRQISRTDIVMCYECCSENLCNRRICGIPESNSTNLACLLGEEADGVPHAISITYCNEGEYCYAGRIQRARPNMYNYGCASQVVCDHLARVSAGSSTVCQRCCSEDGCNAHICHEQVPGCTTLPIDTTQSTNVFTDCWDLRTRGGYQQNGVYDIYPSPAHSRLRVKCDMMTDGGGWTILQRRFDGSFNFTRTFQEYEDGFGNVWGERWLGLRWIHLMTSQDAVQMRVDLCRFDDLAGYAVYEGFNVSGPGDTYRLHAGVYRNGSITDYLRRHDGRVFQVSGRCANTYRGGWWYRSDICYYYLNLNGGRYNGGSRHGIMWSDFGGYYGVPNVRSSELKIRPRNTPGDPAHPYTCPP